MSLGFTIRATMKSPKETGVTLLPKNAPSSDGGASRMGPLASYLNLCTLKLQQLTPPGVSVSLISSISTSLAGRLS